MFYVLLVINLQHLAGYKGVAEYCSSFFLRVSTAKYM